MSIRRGERRGGGGEDAWTRAKKVLLRSQAYVAMWRQAAQGGKENAADLVFLGCCFDILRSLFQNQKPLALLTDRKAVPYSS